MLRYLLTFVSHASYMGSTEFWRVETVPDEATSVLRLVLSQSIVSPDCCSYIVHMVFSSQLSLRCLSHDLVDETYVQVPAPSDASSSEICELVALSASHCAEGSRRSRPSRIRRRQSRSLGSCWPRRTADCG